MAALGHPRVSIASLSRAVDLLPAGVQGEVRELVHTASFRNLETLEDQIIFLREETSLSFLLISLLLGVKRSTLHRYHQAAIARRVQGPLLEPRGERYGPNSALTIEEEKHVIAWILTRQQAQNCPSPREVREYAAELRCSSRGLPYADGEHLSRDWWHKFKQRHQDSIGVKIALSREAVRTRVSEARTRAYFDEIRTALTNLETPMQLVNMDETGFHSRLDRNRRRKCVFCHQCPVHVTFAEETASTTLSLMAAVTGDGGVLPPMFVCKENVSFSAHELQTVSSKLYVTKSPKGYATEKSMLDWLDKVLFPYVQYVTSMLRRPESMVYLIMDNCGVHNTPAVQDRIRRIDRLRIIWLPAHTSHFLQMLDASVFGQLKAVYRNLRTLTTRPKIEGKILRAFHALWNASLPRNVLAGFELTGFTYRMALGGGITIHLDESRVTHIIRTNCQLSADLAPVDGLPREFDRH